MASEPSHPNVEHMVLESCPLGLTTLVLRVLGPIYRKYLDPHGLTTSQWGLMASLAKARVLSQAELGRRMMLERSTISRDLKRLIDQGWVTRSGTARGYQIEITPAGLACVEAAAPDWERAKQEAIALLGDEGYGALGQAAQGLLKNLSGQQP